MTVTARRYARKPTGAIDWADQAACRGMTDFLDRPLPEADQTCGVCPVRQACLRAGLTPPPNPGHAMTLQVVAVPETGDSLWENRNAPGGVGSTLRGLTHSSDHSRERLAMQATRHSGISTCTVTECNRPVSGQGLCQSHRLRIKSGYSPTDLPYARLGAIFWDNVDRRGGDECWLWTGRSSGRDEDHQYGQYYHKGESKAAHIVTYVQAYGPVPAGRVVDHRCRVTLCVNPGHLRAVTNKQNIEHRTRLNRNNESGFRGVRWDAANSRWAAMVKSNRETVFIGRFDDIHHAAEAARLGRQILFTHSDTDTEPLAQFAPDEWWRIAHRVLVRTEPFLDGEMALRAVRLVSEIPLPPIWRREPAA